MNSPLADFLKTRLGQTLPGASAQRKFQAELTMGRHFAPPLPGAKEAAVMIALYPESNQWFVPLTLRADDLPSHAGQISLPGGRLAPGESSLEAALRELEEEIGVAHWQVRVLGPLSQIYLFNSNHFVTPWIGVCQRRPDFVLCEKEVAELVHLPLSHMVDIQNHGRMCHNRRGLRFFSPTIDFDNHRIWGATCMILGELIAIIEEFQAPVPARQNLTPS